MGILSGLLEKLGLNLSGLTENIVVIGLAAFALTLGLFAIRYLSRRRQTIDQQRMAALIKGLHYAGVSRDVFKPKHDAQDHLLRGLRWLFGAGGISGAMYAYASMQPASAFGDALKGVLLGIIPGAIGLAHLLSSWICAWHNRTSTRTSSAQGYYRASARRYQVR
jgi:hypothetical protein